MNFASAVNAIYVLLAAACLETAFARGSYPPFDTTPGPLPDEPQHWTSVVEASVVAAANVTDEESAEIPRFGSLYGGRPNPLGFLVNHYGPCLPTLVLDGGPFVNVFLSLDAAFRLDVFGSGVSGSPGSSVRELIYIYSDPMTNIPIGEINGSCQANRYIGTGHCTMTMFINDGTYDGSISFLLVLDWFARYAVGTAIAGSGDFVGALGQIEMFGGNPGITYNFVWFVNWEYGMLGCHPY